MFQSTTARMLIGAGQEDGYSDAKARAVLHGRYYVSCEDVRAVAPPVMRHRIILNFNAEAEGIRPDDIVKKLSDMIPRDPAEKAS